MVLTLATVSSNLTPIWDKILGNATVSSFDKVIARLLCVSSPNVVIESPIIDFSVLASQTQNTTRGEQRDCGGRGS